MVNIKDIIDIYKDDDYFGKYGNKLETYFLRHKLMTLSKDIHSLKGLAGTFEDHWLYAHSNIKF